MPGGFGTVDEVFEIATLIQTQKIQGFPLVLMGSDYWKPLIAFLRDTMVAQKTIDLADLDLIMVSDSPEDVAEHVREYGMREFGLLAARFKKRWYFFEGGR
jgi:predicted Rossmann-fold nucleotide-binding protein